MYLETILILSKEKAEVHSVDVGEHMGFSKPSVSRAIGILKNAGYVVMEKDGSLYLTDSGRAIAEKIYERHNVLSEVFRCIGVDDETATADACKIEHAISDKTFDALKKYLAKKAQTSEK